jgi:septal ring factor EnvC (AmiA/AmiB activator)
VATGAGAGDDAAAEREAELERIRGEIAALTARLGESERRAAGLAGEIERLSIELSLQERRVAEAVRAHELANTRVATAGERIAELEARLAGERTRLESRVAGLYRLGRHGTVRLAFALEPGAEPVGAIRLLRYLVRRDAASVERFEELGARLAVERAGLENERSAAADWLAQQASRRDELARLERRQADLLAGTRGESARLALRARQLTERAERLSALLDALYGREEAALAGRPIQEFRGLLTWPARGRVTSGFGPRLDPRYRTRVPHNGVDLATIPGEEVRAVYPGKVVFAAEFEGYGPTVVLQHAGRAFTLYAGLERISVERDDLLSLNAVLGHAAARLYFEVRVGNVPEDPERWVR